MSGPDAYRRAFNATLQGRPVGVCRVTLCPEWIERVCAGAEELIQYAPGLRAVINDLRALIDVPVNDIVMARYARIAKRLQTLTSEIDVAAHFPA